MSNKSSLTVATMGIDIGKYPFHVVGLDRRGAIVLRQRWSRGQVEARLANMPRCLIGMEACVGAHHLSRRLHSQGSRGRLAANAGDHRRRAKAADPRLLAGLLVDAHGERLTPSHAVKKGRRYRYYVSAALITEAAKEGCKAGGLPLRRSKIA